MCSRRKQIFKINFKIDNIRSAIVAENVMSLKLTWINIPSILLPRFGRLELRVITFSPSVKIKIKTIIYEIFLFLEQCLLCRTNLGVDK